MTNPMHLLSVMSNVVWAMEGHKSITENGKRRASIKISFAPKNGDPPTSKSKVHQVFLGGSCNPTQWRADVAIPYLKKKGISYFNPQVPEWKPELIPYENQAKKEAEILLFVVNGSQTRGVAAMIEIANLVGSRGHTLVLVFNPLEYCARNLATGDALTPNEIEELMQCQSLLKNLLNTHKVPIYQCLPDALSTISTKLDRSTRLSPVTQSASALTAVASKTKHLFESVAKPFNTFVDWVASKCPPTKSPSVWIITSDIKTVSPLASKHLKNVDYRLVEPSCLDHLTQPDDCLRLFVISDSTRALMEMIIASHCVGLGMPGLVLCIQKLESGVCLEDIKATPQALKDYNRGRDYLEDLVFQSSTLVYKDIEKAMHHIAELSSSH